MVAQDTEHTELVELYPMTDETGQPDTLGSRWCWRRIAYPSHAIVEFCIGQFDTRDQAEADAREHNPDLEVVAMIDT